MLPDETLFVGFCDAVLKKRGKKRDTLIECCLLVLDFLKERGASGNALPDDMVKCLVEHLMGIRKMIPDRHDLLQHASDELRGDRAFMLTVVQKNGDALCSASDELRADKDFVLAAVQQYGYALGSASDELQADKDVVLAAVQQNGDALRCANKGLRTDKDVVLAAVKQNGWALGYASDEL